MSTSIRLLKISEWEILKSVRLNALRADPKAFRSTAKNEEQLTDDIWKSQIVDDDIAIFILFNCEKPIGITYAGIDKNDPSKKTIVFWGSWIDKKFRKKGLSKLLYDSRIDWAKKHRSVQKVIITHRESNVISQKAILSNGFKKISQNPKLWHDGISEDEIFYELKI